MKIGPELVFYILECFAKQNENLDDLRDRQQWTPIENNMMKNTDIRGAQRSAQSLSKLMNLDDF